MNTYKLSWMTITVAKLVFRIIILCSIIIFTLSACDKMDSIYSEFVKEGETIYPQKADSLKTYSGDSRIKISWLLLSDPSITSSKVFWNNKKDSVEVAVQRTKSIDTVSVIINNLDERVYTFEIYTYDAKGNKSVSSEVSGTVYGDIYKSSLVPRTINTLTVTGKDIIIDWKAAIDKSIGNEVIYTDNTGIIQKRHVPVNQNSTKLTDYNLDTDFQYRSLFLTDTAAIDTFLTKYELVQIGKVSKEVNKSDFQIYELPGDYSVPNSSATGLAHVLTNSSVVNSPTYISKVSGHVLPQWFTIDLGEEYELTKIKLFQRGDTGSNKGYLYAGGNLMEFEVWGSLDPDPTYNPDDNGGDFGDRWTLLQACTVNRPSGNILPTSSPRTDNSTEDISAAIAGHKFALENAGNVRYVRIKALKNWHHTGSAYVNIAAVNFEAMQYGMIK